MWTRHLLPLCVIANGLLAQPFFFRKDIRVSKAPYAVVLGDFNADDRPDLAVAAQERLYVLLNAGGGDFGQPVRTEAARETLWLRESADFNVDGLPDLFTQSYGGTVHQVMLGKGDGSFQSPVSYADTAYTELRGGAALAAADFTSDGYADLVISVWDPRGRR